MDCAGTIPGGHNQRRFVLAGGGDLLRANHQKTRGIVGIILDIFGADSEPKYFPGFFAGYRGGILIL